MIGEMRRRRGQPGHPQQGVSICTIGIGKRPLRAGVPITLPRSPVICSVCNRYPLSATALWATHSPNDKFAAPGRHMENMQARKALSKTNPLDLHDQSSGTLNCEGRCRVSRLGHALAVCRVPSPASPPSNRSAATPQRWAAMRRCSRCSTKRRRTEERHIYSA